MLTTDTLFSSSDHDGNLNPSQTKLTVGGWCTGGHVGRVVVVVVVDGVVLVINNPNSANRFM